LGTHREADSDYKGDKVIKGDKANAWPPTDRVRVTLLARAALVPPGRCAPSLAAPLPRVGPSFAASLRPPRGSHGVEHPGVDCHGVESLARSLK
jgi:hypothetical protein